MSMRPWPAAVQSCSSCSQMLSHSNASVLAPSQLHPLVKMVQHDSSVLRRVNADLAAAEGAAGSDSHRSRRLSCRRHRCSPASCIGLAPQLCVLLSSLAAVNRRLPSALQNSTCSTCGCCSSAVAPMLQPFLSVYLLASTKATSSCLYACRTAVARDAGPCLLLLWTPRE